jgi:hypothetical protein
LVQRVVEVARATADLRRMNRVAVHG